MVNLAPKIVSLDETFSVPELNQRMWTRMTGTEISNHNIAAEPLNILCIEDGAGFLKGHVYVITDDGIIADVFAPHTHSSSSSGGTLYDIFRENYKNIIELDMSANIFAEAFEMTERSTGTGGLSTGFLDTFIDTTAHTKYIQLATAGTNGTVGGGNNDFVNIMAGGGRIWFGAPLTLQLKYAVSHNTSIAYRMGVGQPLIEATVGTTAQLGFEGCTGTNQLNRVFSADTSTWSGENMSNMVQSVPFGLRLDLYPSSKITAQDGLGGAGIIKTSNIPPISSATNADALFRAGVSQLTASSQRWLKIYSLRLVGSSYDSQPGVQGWV